MCLHKLQFEICSNTYLTNKFLFSNTFLFSNKFLHVQNFLIKLLFLVSCITLWDTELIIFAVHFVKAFGKFEDEERAHCNVCMQNL